MSVYTQLNQIQIAELLSLYSLGELQSCQEISDGMDNSNYRLILRNPEHVSLLQQEYVLTIFETRQFDELNNLIALMHVVSNKYFKLPAPLANKQGNFLSVLEQDHATKFFIVCPLLEGKHPAPVETFHCAAIGRALATFHLQTKNFDAGIDAQTKLQHPQLFSKGQLDWLIPVFDYAQILDTDLLVLLAEQKVQLQKVKSFVQENPLPQGFCHCDLFPDNSLFLDKQLNAVLDWYDARHSFFVLDLAIVANSWCSDAEGNLDLFLLKNLLAAYENIRPLTAEEKYCWQDFLCLAAVPFWLGRSIYHHEMRQKDMLSRINVKKDPKEYLQLLRQRRSMPAINYFD